MFNVLVDVLALFGAGTLGALFGGYLADLYNRRRKRPMATHVGKMKRHRKVNEMLRRFYDV